MPSLELLIKKHGEKKERYKYNEFHRDYESETARSSRAIPRRRETEAMK